MIKNSVSIQEVIEFLNELVEINQEAVENLIEQRVECNKKLADHPTVQVTAYDGEHPKVGLLGVLNGLFGANEEGWGPIMAVFDEHKLIGFQRTIRKK